MSSDKSFVDFLVDQMRGAGEITSRKMFGEYAIYSGGKVVALVCDNQLFVKPTEAGRSCLGDSVVEAPPYPGARKYFLLADKFEDREWLSDLIRITAKDLPEPKPQKTLPKKNNIMGKQADMATRDRGDKVEKGEKTVRFVVEKETKYTVRYNEHPEPGQPPIIGTLYLQKWFAGEAREIDVTVRMR